MSSNSSASVRSAGETLTKVEGKLKDGEGETTQHLTNVSSRLDTAIKILDALKKPAEDAAAAVRALKTLLDRADTEFGVLAQQASRAQQGSSTFMNARTLLEQGDKDLYALYEGDIKSIAVSVHEVAGQITSTARQIKQSVGNLKVGSEQVSQATDALNEGREKAKKSAQGFLDGINDTKGQIKAVIPAAAKQIGDKGRAVIDAASRK